MSLSAYALVSLEEMKRHLNVSGNEKNDLIEDIIDAVTDLIEQHLDRHIITRGDVTEYHSPPADEADLLVWDWPVITVASVHEDSGWPRTYGSGYLLSDGTDYQAVKPKGIIRRLGSGGVKSWFAGVRTVKVVYSYGYATVASVPARIKQPALKLGALIWAESTRQQFGVSGASDSAGNWTRFSASGITPDIKAMLAPERRWEFSSTAERDS